MSIFMGPEGGSLQTGFTIFDPSTGTSARPLGTGGTWAAESDKLELFPGQTTTLTLGFPPVGGASIFVMVPGFDVVEVPVVQAPAAQMPGSAATWAASSEKAGSFVPIGGCAAVFAAGKGSREPKVEGTSAEARAANRRVEITFTGRSANKLVVVEDVPTSLPKTAGVVVPGTGTAQLPADGTNPKLEARMLSLRQAGGQLVDIQGKSVHRILGSGADHVPSGQGRPVARFAAMLAGILPYEYARRAGLAAACYSRELACLWRVAASCIRWRACEDEFEPLAGLLPGRAEVLFDRLARPGYRCDSPHLTRMVALCSHSHYASALR
ncbi:hypothetical protein IGS67_04700 [Flavimobilis sp. GY10621]|uniref:Uncharacterized protein n=1 Tax=Flavimobilis rhizosphaerae TaxID=2775421 RepID=A0ABR9DNV5_9MICO|nr:hypothetical protein [Flavimobilis rhizosphaerae]MBD9698794.1 hypothetical protein [Flavimobilis rhizosphaerae]